MNFSTMFQTWTNVVTRPNEVTYREEAQQPQATLSTALIWIFLASIAMAVLSAIGVLVSGLLFNGPMLLQAPFSGEIPPEMFGHIAAFSLAGIGLNLVLVLILTPIVTLIAFLLGATIYFVMARVLGGVGDFEKHTYMLASFSAPLLLMAGVVGLVPFVGSCISILVYIYQMVLTYFAVKTVHELTPGKAVVVALMPLLISALCGLLWIGMIAGLIFGRAMSS